MTDARTFPHACPSCGKKLDAASAADGSEKRPSAGDVTLCMYCAAVLRFSPEMRPLLMTAEQLMKFDAQTAAELARCQAVIRSIIADRKASERSHH